MGYTAPFLDVRKIAGAYSVYPPSATSTDDLRLFANTTDSYGRIDILGNDGISIFDKAGTVLSIYDGATVVLTIGYVTANNALEITGKVNNKDLALLTTGSGVLKVPGTATATGDVAINGHYDIKDSTGATIKLATVA